MDSRKLLRPNYRNGGMKKEVEATTTPQRIFEVTAGIRVGETSGVKGSFWPAIVRTAENPEPNGVQSRADDIRKAMGWECPVDCATIDALCQLHEVYVEEKRRRTDKASRPSKVPEKRAPGEKGKEKMPAFRLASDIEQQTDLRKVFEERVLDSRVEFSLRELLGIAKKEFHDLPMDLIKRKRQTMEEPGSMKVNANDVLMADSEAEDELPDSHYTKPHWAHAITETLVRIGNMRDPVVALIDHGSEINLMSKDLYRKGKWPITKDHGWKI